MRILPLLLLAGLAGCPVVETTAEETPVEESIVEVTPVPAPTEIVVVDESTDAVSTETPIVLTTPAPATPAQ